MMGTLVEQSTVTPSRGRAISSIVGFCAGSGAIFGALAMLTSTRLYMMVGLRGLPFAIGIGCITGLVCAILVVPLLIRREAWRAKPIVAWGTAAMMVVWIAATNGRNAWPIFAAPLIFLGFAILARIMLPAVSFTPGCCIYCNYDLRGSYEIGRCPECGLSIDQTRDPLQLPPLPAPSSLLEKLWTFSTHHALIPLLLLTLGAILKIETPKTLRAWRSSELVHTLENIKPQTIIDLNDLVQFKWDTVYAIGPYSNLTPPPSVNPSSWKEMADQIAFGLVDEGEILFVFVHHNEVVEHFRIHRWVDVGEIMGQPIDRTEAQFDVVSDRQAGRWKLVRRLYCTPSDAGVD